MLEELEQLLNKHSVAAIRNRFGRGGKAQKEAARLRRRVAELEAERDEALAEVGTPGSFVAVLARRGAAGGRR